MAAWACTLGALQLYALLTVGDGLVSQVPALLISTATGVLVTRAASEDNLGTDVTTQILRYPQILLITAGVLALFGLVPGMPTIPFLVIALLLWWLTSILRREQREKAEAGVEQEVAAQEQIAYKPENVLSLLAVDPMEVEIGYSLIRWSIKTRWGSL